MMELKNKHCEPCKKGGKPLELPTVQEYFKEIKGWKLIDAVKIEKTVAFIDFKSALAFINEVGDLAEFEGHHPDLNLYDWNKVTISLRTYCIKGLSPNDFIMAAKIDQILSDSEASS